MGSRVHEALEYLYSQLLETGSIPVLDRVMDYYHELWNESWHDRIAVVKRRFRVVDYFSMGEELIRWYYRANYPFEVPVAGVEVELNFPLDDAGKYRIKGFIDRLDHDGNGHWTIHDYKTGRRVMNQTEADRDIQLALYQVGLEYQSDQPVEKVDLVWHYLQARKTLRSYRSHRQLKNLKSRVITNIDEIQKTILNTGNFPARESPLCNWCYFWEECPAKTGTNPYILSPGRD